MKTEEEIRKLLARTEELFPSTSDEWKEGYAEGFAAAIWFVLDYKEE